MTYGPLRRKTLSVSPCEGENLFPEVERNTGPCVSPLRRGEQEGSSPSQQKTCSRRLSETRALASLPASKTVAVSLQRMTCGPLRARPSLSLPVRERTCSRRLGETPALASLPASKTLSVSPCEGEDLFPEVGRNTSPCVSPLHRGEQEGSCGAGILRFPHRLTDARCEGEHRAPAGLPPNPTGKQEQTRTDDPRPRRGRSLWLGGRSRYRSEALIAGERTGASAGWGGVPPHPTGFAPFLAGQKGDTLRPEPESRLYGMSLRADWDDQRLDGTGKDTSFDPHISNVRNGDRLRWRRSPFSWVGMTARSAPCSVSYHETNAPRRASALL